MHTHGWQYLIKPTVLSLKIKTRGKYSILCLAYLVELFHTNINSLVIIQHLLSTEPDISCGGQ